MNGQHAVVVGASMAGLVAARVLSERFRTVTIVDRDGLPTAMENRDGVPQGRHGHGLLASGYRSLKRLFPGLEADLLAAGACPIDVIGDIRWFQHGYYKAKFRSGFDGIMLSRPLLEGAIRLQVRAIPNVTILERTHAAGLVTDRALTRVTGVLLEHPGLDTVALEADLVVDASGRASRSPVWLQALGYRPPPVHTVEVGLGYTTRTFRRRPGDLNGDLGAIIAPTPPSQTRVGFVIAMEGDRWMVSIGGWLGDHAPTDPAGFLDFARTLSRPDIYDLIEDAEPLTDAVTYAFRANVRRRYEDLGRFPEQYLVVGDAVCSFNPFYGQGMSVSALEGLLLERLLTEGRSTASMWRPFFKAAGKIVDTPWMIAAGSDFAFPGVTGPKPAGTGLVNWYLGYVHRAASTDRRLCRTFFDVANLLKPASTLFRPSVVARVAGACLSSPAQSRETYRAPVRQPTPAHPPR